MSSIPLVALDAAPRPAQNAPPDPLAEFQRASALKTAAGQQQIQQQQIQGNAMSLQQQQQQMQDMQKLRDLAPQYVSKDDSGKVTGYDIDGISNAALGAGINPQTVAGLRNTYAESVQKLTAASKAQLDLEQEKNDKAFEVLEGLRGLAPKTPAAAPQVQGGAPAGPAPSQPGAQAAALPGVGDAGFGQPKAPIQQGIDPGFGKSQIPSQPGIDPGFSSAPSASPQSAQPQVQATPEAMQGYHQAIMKLARLGINVGQLNPNQFPSDDQLNGFEAGLGTHKQALADAKEMGETKQSNAKAALDNTEAGLKQIQLNLAKNATPGSFDQQIDHLNLPPDQAQVLKSQINDSLGRGDVESAKKIASGALENLQAINKEVAISTNPKILAAKLQLSKNEERARQAISDGDPNAAAQLLISGTVAPSQLISSRKPAFAQQAFTAAQQMKPGWNAQKADADYKVASSPAQVAFFGSAKSLTDPGGTLDQLAEAGKDIPQNQIPVFNTVADAIRASTGSGPVAKYAAIALGVADDYAKVMGGGQGSDTSRTQALNIISQKQSPEQRAASIEGIRGAVGSQTRSRIGNNNVLRNMYGDSEPQQGQPQTGAGFWDQFPVHR